MKDVKLCADDLLCAECDVENERQLAVLHKQATEDTTTHTKTRSNRQTADKKQAKKAAAKSVTSDDSEEAGVSTNSVGTLHQSTADSECQAGSQSVVTIAAVEFNELRQRVQTQQKLIEKLQCQLEFVLSFLDIKDTDSNDLAAEPQSVHESVGLHLINRPTADIENNGSATDAQAWKQVATRKPRRPQPTLQQSVVTAVYADQSLKKRHETDLIISGLKPRHSQSDVDLFVELCDVEFSVQPCVTFAKRLGQPQNGRVQPLLVVLKQAEQVKEILSKARLLRRSADEATRSSVYINPYMTRAEAAAAYQARMQRRLSQQRRKPRGISVSSAVDNQNNNFAGSLPNHAILDRQEVVISSAALNPLADTFNPPVIRSETTN